MSHELRPEKPYASVAVPAAPTRVHSQRPLAPGITSAMANDKSHNEMIMGAVDRSPRIYFTAEENLS